MIEFNFRTRLEYEIKKRIARNKYKNYLYTAIKKSDQALIDDSTVNSQKVKEIITTPYAYTVDKWKWMKRGKIWVAL